MGILLSLQKSFTGFIGIEMSDSMMSSDPSISEIPTHGSEDDADSLPESEPDSDDVTISDSDYDDSDAERQWKESLEQLELLLSMVLVPYAGKYFGRKFAFWGQSSAAIFCPCDG